MSQGENRQLDSYTYKPVRHPEKGVFLYAGRYEVVK
nr:MAG TPA: hypothetical protein [Caudoviricetes sp.]